MDLLALLFAASLFAAVLMAVAGTVLLVKLRKLKTRRGSEGAVMVCAVCYGAALFMLAFALCCGFFIR